MFSLKDIQHLYRQINDLSLYHPSTLMKRPTEDDLGCLSLYVYRYLLCALLYCNPYPRSLVASTSSSCLCASTLSGQSLQCMGQLTHQGLSDKTSISIVATKVSFPHLQGNFMKLELRFRKISLLTSIQIYETFAKTFSSQLYCSDKKNKQK